MDDVDTKPSLRERAAGEFKEFCVIAAYLYVCFTALAYLKFAILEAHGIAFAPFGFAAAKALICAKFVSLGHALHLAERFKRPPLIWQVLHKSFAFLALLIVLNVLEEITVGWWNGHTLMGSLQEIAGGTRDQMIATAIIMLLILIPFFVLRALGEVVGERTLARLFFEPRRVAHRE
jgi:hypothetical protein